MRPADRDMTRHTAPLSSQRRSTRTAETVELGRASGPSVGRTLVIIDLLVRHHILAVDRADAVCASRNGGGRLAGNRIDEVLRTVWSKVSKRQKT